MPESIRAKLALVALLVGTALVAASMKPMRVLLVSPLFGFSFLFGLLLFGIINIFLNIPDTKPLRALAIVSTMATLIWPQVLGGLWALFVFLAWPLGIVVVSLATRTADPAPTVEVHGVTRARVATAALIIAVAIAAVMYRFLVHHRLEQTAALFVGIPTLLALLVVFLVSPRSAAGVACKAVTIGLLVSMLFLGEGVLCVLMSAPLFYAIAVLIGSAVDFSRRRLDRRAQSTVSCLAVLVLIPMSLEGVTDATSFNRDEWVVATKLVHAPAQAVGEAIFEPPRFNRSLPLYLRAGFPRPTATEIKRTPTGGRWTITIRGGEMHLNGMEPRVGTLELELEEARPGLVRFHALRDDSHMTHFLLWREAQVEWEPVSADLTRVTWKLRYRRGLDPEWYFGPWERYAATLAAGYLIDAVATPATQ
jgi:hypothetical protein